MSDTHAIIIHSSFRNQLPMEETLAEYGDYQHTCVEGPIPLRDMEKPRPTPCPHQRTPGVHPHNEYEVIWDPMLQTNTLVPKHVHTHSPIHPTSVTNTTSDTVAKYTDSTTDSSITILKQQEL